MLRFILFLSCQSPAYLAFSRLIRKLAVNLRSSGAKIAKLSAVITPLFHYDCLLYAAANPAADFLPKICPLRTSFSAATFIYL